MARSKIFIRFESDLTWTKTQISGKQQRRHIQQARTRSCTQEVTDREHPSPQVHAIPNDYWLTPVFVSVDIDLSRWSVSLLYLRLHTFNIHPVHIFRSSFVQRTDRFYLSGEIRSHALSLTSAFGRRLKDRIQVLSKPSIRVPIVAIDRPDSRSEKPKSRWDLLRPSQASIVTFWFLYWSYFNYIISFTKGSWYYWKIEFELEELQKRYVSNHRGTCFLHLGLGYHFGYI